MSNSCIITGATGYIGSHVLKYLLSKGWRIHVIADPVFGYDAINDVFSNIDLFEYDGDINRLIDYFNKIEAKVVFHLAAAVITNPLPSQIRTLVQSNVQFGAEILEAMRITGIRMIISTGSYWQNYNRSEYNPVDLYAATKEAYEKIVQFYVDAYNFRHINLRLFDVYGEDDKRPKLWNILKKNAGTDKVIDISPGEQLIDMVHISDVCTAYEAAYEYLINTTNCTNHVFGVYTGRKETLKKIITLFEKIIGKPIPVNFGGKEYKPREVFRPFSGYDSLPNWKPVISLEDGLLRMAEYE